MSFSRKRVTTQEVRCTATRTEATSEIGVYRNDALVVKYRESEVSATMGFMKKEPPEPWNEWLILSRAYDRGAATHEVRFIVLIQSFTDKDSLNTSLAWAQAPTA